MCFGTGVDTENPTSKISSARLTEAASLQARPSGWRSTRFSLFKPRTDKRAVIRLFIITVECRREKGQYRERRSPRSVSGEVTCVCCFFLSFPYLDCIAVSVFQTHRFQHHESRAVAFLSKLCTMPYFAITGAIAFPTEFRLQFFFVSSDPVRKRQRRLVRW